VKRKIKIKDIISENEGEDEEGGEVDDGSLCPLLQHSAISTFSHFLVL